MPLCTALALNRMYCATQRSRFRHASSWCLELLTLAVCWSGPHRQSVPLLRRHLHSRSHSSMDSLPLLRRYEQLIAAKQIPKACLTPLPEVLLACGRPVRHCSTGRMNAGCLVMDVMVSALSSLHRLCCKVRPPDSGTDQSCLKKQQTGCHPPKSNS